MPTKSKQKSAASAAAPIQNGFSLISNQKLLELYSTMLECRLLEEHLGAPRKGNIARSKTAGKNSVSVGQEASIVGVLLDLFREDAAAPAPGDFIPSLVRGAPLEKILAGFRASAGHAPAEMDCASLRIVPSSPAVATRMTLATGVALANKTNKNDKIVVVFSREAAPLDAWHETLQFAAMHNLPILYVRMNVREAEDAPPTAKNRLNAKTWEVPCLPVDGNDVVAVYRVACESISRARQGRGPTLIECRICDGYEDSIQNMEKYLDRKGLFPSDHKLKVTAGFNKKLDSAIKSSRQNASPRR